MKATNIFYFARVFTLPFLVFCLALTPQKIQAQDSGYLDPAEKYSREELTQMLAPIALYPDALLSQVLMASTYPIEVIEADRWVKMNPGLSGEAFDEALLDKDWDPSVAAVCHFPAILSLMSERIGETTNLGNAFLAQEEEVMAMVQELRARAHAQNSLASTNEQKVIVEKETIIIEPADPQVIYVPYYDPYTVYGPWWYPAYHPYYWGPPGVNLGFGISYWPGFYFGFSFGDWSYFDWHRRTVYVDVHKRPRYVRHDRWVTAPGRWQHAPSHRRGVAYRDKATARRYDQYPRRAPDFRRDTRGFPERQTLRRDRQEQGRVELDRRRQGRAAPDNQSRQRIEQNTQVRQRLEADRQLRERTERSRLGQTKNEKGKQERQRIEPVRPERSRVEPVRQNRVRVEATQPGRTRLAPVKTEKPRVAPVKPERARVERFKQSPTRENIFNRVDNGRRERISGERGKGSRQGTDAGTRGWGGSKNTGKGNSRNWR